jgi:peptide/nickel transport system substrate-binding protein
VKEFVVNSHITLDRNPFYWGKKPYYDQIVFNIIPDAQTRLLAFRSGQIDGTFDVPGAQLKDWQSTPNSTMVNFASDGFHGLTIDMEQAPFNDVHVRRAIAYAIDRKGIINAVFGGAATPANTLDDPSFFAGVLPDADVKKAFAGIPSYSYDPAKAKAELAQSSQPKGFTTTMNVPQDSANSVAISQAIQANLKAVGINLNLNMMPGGPRFDVILEHGPNLGLQIIGNVADVPDPIELPWLYFKSDQASKGGNNSSNYKNATADKLISFAQGTTDEKAAARAALQVSKMGADAAAVVPIEWFTWHAATKKAIKPSGLGAFYYNTIWVNNLATPGS